MAAIGLIAVLATCLYALPASVITYFLPSAVQADNFSGSVWHGSAGKLVVNGRDAGALEWTLHPAALWHLSVVGELHWVKLGFQVDGAAEVDRQGFVLHNVKGNGPIEDLQDFGIAAGWRGMADLNFSQVIGNFARLATLAGDIQVTHLTSTQVAGGADLGGYSLHLPEAALEENGAIAGQLNDLGGPIEARAQLHVALQERSALISGTMKARAEAPVALQDAIQGVAQMRGRDSQGRVPIELEFTF